VHTHSKSIERMDDVGNFYPLWGSYGTRITDMFVRR